jgi:hypothetical protein
MMLTNTRVRLAIATWTILTLSLVVWSVAIGARMSSSALLFVLFAAPLGVFYALGFGTNQQTVGEMLHSARPKDQL